MTPGVGAPTAKRPAVAASTPAIIQANMDTRPMWMPISAAASPSSAAARIEMPQLENLKVRKKAPISTAATTIASARLVVIPTPPIEIVSPPHGWPTLRMSEPMRRVSSVTMIRSTPIVRIARLITGAPRRRLMSTPLDQDRRHGGAGDADRDRPPEAERLVEAAHQVGARAAAASPA